MGTLKRVLEESDIHNQLPAIKESPFPVFPNENKELEDGNPLINTFENKNEGNLRDGDPLINTFENKNEELKEGDNLINTLENKNDKPLTEGDILRSVVENTNSLLNVLENKGSDNEGLSLLNPDNSNGSLINALQDANAKGDTVRDRLDNINDGLSDLISQTNRGVSNVLSLSGNNRDVLNDALVRTLSQFTGVNNLSSLNIRDLTRIKLVYDYYKFVNIPGLNNNLNGLIQKGLDLVFSNRSSDRVNTYENKNTENGIISSPINNFQIVNGLPDLNFKSYQKNLMDIELWGTHLWDMALKKYNLPNVPSEYAGISAPDPPTVGGFVPATTFTINESKVSPSTIPMFGSSKLDIPSELVLNKVITISMIDQMISDENGVRKRGWYDYLRDYMRLLVRDDFKVIPYKNICTEIHIYILDFDKTTLFTKKYLGILLSPNIDITGTSDSAPNELTLTYSIVGELS